MMKVMKKISTFLVCLCMMVCMVPAVAHAADGELRFSDPSTTVGATFEVTAKLSADYTIDSCEATLTYDTSYLKFVGGEGATDNGGTITLTGTADGDYELSWAIEFQALEEGGTKIQISDVSAVDTDGDPISVTRGNSAIEIGPGDPSLIKDDVPDGEQVDVNGTTYTIAGEISEIVIPHGFVASEMNYNGTTYPAVIQENGDTVAMYLKSSDSEGEFFIYDEETNSFLPFCQISISAERYIIILSDEEKTSELPEYLQQTTMTIDDKEFVAWQNVESVEYYVVYALNSDGNEGYYQYDTVDGTYQRYIPEEVGVEEVEEESSAPVDQFLQLIEDNLLVCILGAALAILFLFLLLIIVAIKLRHRNIELDDLYEEYGIDEDEEDDEPVKAKKEKKGLFGKKSKDDFDEDDFEDENDFEDDYEEDDFEDDYEEDDFDEDDFDEDDDYEEDDFGSFGFSSEKSDEEDIDDLDELLNARVKKPAVRRTAEKQVKETVKEAPRKVAKTTVKPAQTRKSRLEEVQKPAVKPAAPRRTVQQPVAPKVGKPQQKVGHSDLDDTFKMDLIDLD